VCSHASKTGDAYQPLTGRSAASTKVTAHHLPHRPSQHSRGQMSPSWQRRAATDAVRGALIGTVEVVPGVSGGTVALIVGVYETVITSAGHVLSGLRRGLFDLPRG